MQTSCQASFIFPGPFDDEDPLVIDGVVSVAGVDPSVDPQGLRVAEQEAHQQRLADQLGADPNEIWSAYRLLQAADRFSLYFCTDRPEGPASVGPIPNADGSQTDLVVEPLGEWSARLDPYPFRDSEREAFTLVRRLLPDRVWDSDDEFGAAFFAAPTETVEIELSR